MIFPRSGGMFIITYAFITFSLFTAMNFEVHLGISASPEYSFGLSQVSGGLPMSVLKAVLVTSLFLRVIQDAGSQP